MTGSKRLIQTEVVLASVLRYGVILCLAIISFGLVLRFFQQGTTAGIDSRELIQELMRGREIHTTTRAPVTPTEFWHGLSVGHADTIMALGLVLLIGLPIFRVAATVVIFAVERDWVYFFIGLAVFCILISGIFLGKVL